MEKLEKALCHINQLDKQTSADRLDMSHLSLLIVTVTFLGFMLSVRLTDLTTLLLFAVYPIVNSQICNLGFGRIFIRSLIVLPFVMFIGIFNPILDHRPAMTIGNTEISMGWVTLISIVIRGILSVQSVMILIYACGFNNVCHSLRHIGIPAFLTTQMQFIYRYIYVIMEESITMRRARIARGFGRKRMPLKMWATMIGQLFIRTVNRSEAINKAMLARCFCGVIPEYIRSNTCWRTSDILTIIIWTIVFATLRYVDFLSFINF